MTRSLSPSSSPSRTDRMNDVTEDGEGGGAGEVGGVWGQGWCGNGEAWGGERRHRIRVKVWRVMLEFGSPDGPRTR